VPDAFYEPDADGFLATELTRGPWDPGAQHAGPPAALLGRAIERLEGDGEFQVGRVTYEILRSVPIGPVRVEARIARPGRRVRLAQAELSVDGVPHMRAAAWLIRRAELDLPAGSAPAPEPPPAPDSGEEKDFFPTGQAVGYHTAMQIRFLGGSFLEAGPARAWLRMRHPLVAGEEPTPLQRTLIVADVGNGISAALDWRRFVFINVDLTVHLERLPAGEWVCIDSVTLPQGSGNATTDSLLCDEAGRIGRALQTLLVAARESAASGEERG
jgi:hypothetical protein